MDEILSETLKLTAAVVAPVLAGLVAALLVKALKKLGLEVEAEQQAKVEHLVRQAILRAEEWSATRLKASMGTTAEMKLQRAIQDVQAKAPGVTTHEAASMIHAKLPELQLGAATSFSEGLRMTPATAELSR